MAGLAPDDVIASRRWEQALFTTYALSLTFFESIVLLCLRDQGCRDIWVIADAEGYRASLMERRSSRVGQEYRLIPVALPRGVFHPKCSYLAGPEGDLLLVGSGNLTFGGYGRNLEVLEVLEPASAPAAFDDFARLLDALRARDDFIAPDLSWASTFAAQARSAARAFVEHPAEGQPRLIHSIHRPTVDQIADVCAANGGGRQLTVLSPFHDANGAAVRKLSERTGSSMITVGLSPREEEPSPFPFAKAKSWNKPLRAVRPALSDDKRGLHAKWIEVELPEAKLTVTGSINATTKSLCTTDNVEVGVLRLESKATAHVRWKNVAIPTDFAERPVRAPGLGNSCLVHASILGDGVLVGRLLAMFDPSGVWAGRLVLASGDQVEITVTVSPSGDFRAPLSQAERFVFASALQIELTRGERTARGWVQLDEILRMPRLHRLGVTSLLRLINREETEEDDAALLDYFAMSSSQHLATFARRIKVTERGAEETASDDEPEVIVELDEIAPDPELSSWGGGCSPNAPVGGEEAVLERVLAQLRRRLISQPAQRGMHAGERGAGALAGDDDDPDESGDDAPFRRVESALEHFDEQMRSMANEADSDAARRAALVIWFEVTMHMLLRRLRDRARAVEFLRTWFHEACAETRVTEGVTALEQHVFTAAALVPLLVAADVDQTALRARVHEALERLSGGDVAQERALSALLADRHVGFTSLLLDGQHADLRASLEAILAMRTRRRDLQEAMVAFQAGRPPDPRSSLFSKDQPCGPQLHAALSRRGPRPNVREQRTDDAMCAHCFVELNTQAQLDFALHRVAQCTSCMRLTIRLKP